MGMCIGMCDDDVYRHVPDTYEICCKAAALCLLTSQPHHVCIDMCTDLCLYTCIDMCADLYTDMCMDMCTDVCIDVCIGMCIDLCIDMRFPPEVHVHTLVCMSLLARLYTFSAQFYMHHCTHAPVLNRIVVAQGSWLKITSLIAS